MHALQDAACTLGSVSVLRGRCRRWTCSPVPSVAPCKPPNFTLNSQQRHAWHTTTLHICTRATPAQQVTRFIFSPDSASAHSRQHGMGHEPHSAATGTGLCGGMGLRRYAPVASARTCTYTYTYTPACRDGSDDATRRARRHLRARRPSGPPGCHRDAGRGASTRSCCACGCRRP